MRQDQELGRYIETLKISQGPRAGEHFKLLPWERRFLKGCFDGDVLEAGLTIGRGAGKSTLVAAIGCALVDPDGPLHQSRAEAVLAAASLKQAKIIFDHMTFFLRSRGFDLDDRTVWRSNSSVNSATLLHRASGARAVAVGNNENTAHGLAPTVVFADEGARWPSGGDGMVAALRTSLGKQAGGKLIALGTRHPSEEHWFSELLREADYVQRHQAEPDDPPGQKRTWRKANPSLRHAPELMRVTEKEWDRAQRDPAVLASFRALRLNLAELETISTTLLDPGVWEEAEGEAEQRGPYVLGLDLGTSAAMSAASACYLETGAADAFATYGDNPGLLERGLKDGCGRDYQTMHDRGEIVLSPGRTSKIPVLLAEILRRWGPPIAIVGDHHAKPSSGTAWR